MVIQFQQNIIFVSGGITHDCWPILHARCLRVLEKQPKATIHCGGVTHFSHEGLETLVSAYEFALNSPYDIDVTGLAPEVEAAVLERLELRGLPRAS